MIELASKNIKQLAITEYYNNDNILQRIKFM